MADIEIEKLNETDLSKSFLAENNDHISCLVSKILTLVFMF